MNEDMLKKVDPKKVEKAVEILRNQVGDNEAKKIEGAFKNDEQMQNLTKNLGPKEMEMVVKVMNNPEALRMLLSSSKAKEGLKNFLK